MVAENVNLSMYQGGMFMYLKECSLISSLNQLYVCNVCNVMCFTHKFPNNGRQRSSRPSRPPRPSNLESPAAPGFTNAVR